MSNPFQGTFPYISSECLCRSSRDNHSVFCPSDQRNSQGISMLELDEGGDYHMGGTCTGKTLIMFLYTLKYFLTICRYTGLRKIAHVTYFYIFIIHGNQSTSLMKHTLFMICAVLMKINKMLSENII